MPIKNPLPRAAPTKAGAAAEERAARYLSAQGLRVLQRNFRVKGGEIDLVLQDGDTLVFAEVRQRASSRFGGALGSISAAKRQRLQFAAHCYLQRLRTSSVPPCRFDAVGIEAGRITWLKGAWLAD